MVCFNGFVAMLASVVALSKTGTGGGGSHVIGSLFASHRQSDVCAECGASGWLGETWQYLLDPARSVWCRSVRIFHS